MPGRKRISTRSGHEDLVSWLCWNAHRPVNRPIQVRFQTHNPIFSGLDGADRRLGEISSLQKRLTSASRWEGSIGTSAIQQVSAPSHPRDKKRSPHKDNHPGRLRRDHLRLVQSGQSFFSFGRTKRLL